MTMITRCTHCNKALAINPTAWASREGMFCSKECAIQNAMRLYNEDEFTSEEDLHHAASLYVRDITEEISREDYGARVEHFTAYSCDYDMSIIFEQIYEGDDVITMKVVGWYFGEPTTKKDEDGLAAGLTASFVD